jgi:hypothetical protein
VTLIGRGFGRVGERGGGWLASLTSGDAMTEPDAIGCGTPADVPETTVETRIGTLGFELGLPTEATAAKLYDELDFQRAVQAYLWGLTSVGVAQHIAGLIHDTGAESGDLALYDDYRSKSVGLAYNNSTPYITGYIDLGLAGPVVIDYPAGLSAGALIDLWERPVADVGLPGADHGQGAKYLVVGPGQDTPEDAEGHRVIHSRILKNGFFFRTLDTEPAKAKALREAVHIYPYSERDHPSRRGVLLPKADGDLLNQGQPRGLAFWERLSEALAAEPGEDRDRFFIAMLKPLGIEAGQPFAPDERQQRILVDAAAVGEAMAKTLAFRPRADGILYRPGAHWRYAVPPWFNVDQDEGASTQFDERNAVYYLAYGMSNGAVTKTVGIGQAYIAAYQDTLGHPFDGSQSYRLHVPANAPAKLFWSVSLYDLDTRCIIQNETNVPDHVSLQDLDQNADGSVDIYLGPASPDGHEKNWIQTVPGRAWYAYLRLYGPTQDYFDRSWAIPDIEKAG